MFAIRQWVQQVAGILAAVQQQVAALDPRIIAEAVHHLDCALALFLVLVGLAAWLTRRGRFPGRIHFCQLLVLLGGILFIWGKVAHHVWLDAGGLTILVIGHAIEQIYDLAHLTRRWRRMATRERGDGKAMTSTSDLVSSTASTKQKN